MAVWTNTLYANGAPAAVETFDGGAGTYTRRSMTGTVQETRPFTTDEQAQSVTRDTWTNGDTLRQKAQQALNANATFQAIASPTNAQNATQVQALTKQCNGIIRLLLGALDSTTGT